MTDWLAGARAVVDDLVSDRAGGWDLAGEIPLEVLRKLGAQGLLCAQVPTSYGGIGATSLDNGEFTAGVGARCSSLRSVMTSQGMAAWTIGRLGNRTQQRAHLPALASGSLAAVAFSEPGAGSDLSAIATTVSRDGGDVVVDGTKKWITAAAYADLLVVFGRPSEDPDLATAVIVPTDAPGVTIDRVSAPLGCRAAGHANVRLDRVRVPADHMLGGGGLPLPLLTTTALAYGRMSVAWGCVGILRACRTASARHATTREQSGKPIAEHQLVARHLAELYVAEQSATRACEHAGRQWDAKSPDLVIATVLAKHTAATLAASAAASAVQVLASAGARDGEVVARAYRDAKMMEIIEGSNEICQLLLARHAVATS